MSHRPRPPATLLLALLLPSLLFTPSSIAQEDGEPAAAPSQETQAQASPPATQESGDARGRVAVSLQPEEVTVGDRVRAEITVVWMGEKPTEPVRFPTWQDTWGDAEVLEITETDAFEDQSGRFVYRQTLELAAFETGEIELPPRSFAVPLGEDTLELRSEPVGFKVTSLLPTPEEGQEDAGAEPIEARGGAPPLTPGILTPAFVGYHFALLLILFAGLEALRRQLASDPAGAGEGAPVDPLTLLAPMAELEARLGRLDPQHPGAAHTLLSLALRRFMARRLHFPAVESTTTEIQRQLLGASSTGPFGPRLDAQTAQRLLTVLQHCDLVKFAGMTADPAAVRRRSEEALELGRAVERQLSPTPGTDATDDPGPAAPAASGGPATGSPAGRPAPADSAHGGIHP